MSFIDPELYLSRLNDLLRHNSDYKLSLTSPQVKDALLSKKWGGGINDKYLTEENLETFSDKLLDFVNYAAQQYKKPQKIYARFSNSKYDIDGAKSIDWREEDTGKDINSLPREAGLSVIDDAPSNSFKGFLSNIGRYGFMYGRNPDEQEATLNILTGNKVKDKVGADGETLLQDNIRTLRRFPVAIGDNLQTAIYKSNKYNDLLDTLNNSMDLIHSNYNFRKNLGWRPNDRIVNNPDKAIEALLQIKRENK